jgi:hypothetical protein
MSERVGRRFAIEARVSGGPRKSNDKYEEHGSDLHNTANVRSQG